MQACHGGVLKILKNPEIPEIPEKILKFLKKGPEIPDFFVVAGQPLIFYLTVCCMGIHFSLTTYIY